MIADAPYARMLGIKSIMLEDGAALMMPASPALEGRPGFLYGGVIASLLELACLEAAARERDGSWPRPITMSFDFLRGGLMTASYARARLVRVGRRVVNADALCWQTDREKPIASCRMNLMLDDVQCRVE